MREHDTDDIKRYGGIPLDIVQRYLNFHYSVSLDLSAANGQPTSPTISPQV